MGAVSSFLAASCRALLHCMLKASWPPEASRNLQATRVSILSAALGVGSRLQCWYLRP